MTVLVGGAFCLFFSKCHYNECHTTVKILWKDCVLSVNVFTQNVYVYKERTAALCDLNIFIDITLIGKIALKSIFINIQNIFDRLWNMSQAVVAA